MTPMKLEKLRARYSKARTVLSDLEIEIQEACIELIDTIVMEKRKASIMFTHPNGARWTTSLDRNTYSERNIWLHDGKKRGEKIIDATRMSNRDIRLALATDEVANRVYTTGRA